MVVINPTRRTDTPKYRDERPPGMSGHEYQQEERERVTAPQQEYSMRDVGVGLVVFLVGAVLAFGIPLALF